MRQGFYTHSRIMEEPGEENSPHLDHQITQWHRQASLTTQMGTSRPPPPAPGAGGAGVLLRGTPPPPGMKTDASSNPPPPPAQGGVGIKRGKPGSSNAPMEMEDGTFYGGPPPPPPRAGEIAAQLFTNLLQQNAMAQQAAQWALNEAQVAHIMRTHQTEKRQMVIPDEFRPVHHHTLKPMLKKPREIQPATPPPPTAIEQATMVDISNAEGAGRAHARSGGDASTLIGRIIDNTTSAASGVLKNMSKRHSWQQLQQP